VAAAAVTTAATPAAPAGAAVTATHAALVSRTRMLSENRAGDARIWHAGQVEVAAAAAAADNAAALGKAAAAAAVRESLRE